MISGKLKISSFISTARIPYENGIDEYKRFTSAQSICEPMGSCNLDVLYETSKLERRIEWNSFFSFSK